MTPREQLITWLNNAYAMERNLIKVLENHAKDAREFPAVHERDEQHLAETRGHAKAVERCLQLLDEKPSTMKSAMGDVMGLVQGAASGMYRDELMKNFLSDYAMEHFEIACYRSLIAAADDLGETEISQICSGILAEEEEMAAWLEERIPEVTRLTLQQMAQT